MSIGLVHVRAVRGAFQLPRPRFTLADLSVKVGRYVDAAEREQHSLDTVSGSYPTTGKDEFPFSPRQGALTSLWLRVPEVSADGVSSHAFDSNPADQIARIETQQPASFSAPRTTSRSVGPAGSFLMCLTSLAPTTAEPTWLTVAEGFSLRFRDGTYDGWILHGPERFLSAGRHAPNRIQRTMQIWHGGLKRTL